MSAHLRLANRTVWADAPPASAAIRVVLADDHARVRRNLRLLLDRESGIDVVMESGDVSSALGLVHQHAPDVLVLDLQLVSEFGIEGIQTLHSRRPNTRIVVLTMEHSPAIAERALAAGAVGFVLKDRADAELADAVRSAALGKEFVSPSIADALQSRRQRRNGTALSARETEVLRLIALGYTSAEVANQLSLSRRTVDSHRANIHRKLGLATRAELVRHALALHLIGG